MHCGASIWIHYDPPFCFLQGAGICGDFLLSFVFRFVFFVRPVSFIFGLVDRRNGPLWSFSILLSYPFVTLFFLRGQNDLKQERLYIQCHVDHPPFIESEMASL